MAYPTLNPTPYLGIPNPNLELPPVERFGNMAKFLHSLTPAARITDAITDLYNRATGPSAPPEDSDWGKHYSDLIDKVGTYVQGLGQEYGADTGAAAANTGRGVVRSVPNTVADTVDIGTDFATRGMVRPRFGATSRAVLQQTPFASNQTRADTLGEVGGPFLVAGAPAAIRSGWRAGGAATDLVKSYIPRQPRGRVEHIPANMPDPEVQAMDARLSGRIDEIVDGVYRDAGLPNPKQKMLPAPPAEARSPTTGEPFPDPTDAAYNPPVTPDAWHPHVSPTSPHDHFNIMHSNLNLEGELPTKYKSDPQFEAERQQLRDLGYDIPHKEPTLLEADNHAYRQMRDMYPLPNFGRLNPTMYERMSDFMEKYLDEHPLSEATAEDPLPPEAAYVVRRMMSEHYGRPKPLPRNPHDPKVKDILWKWSHEPLIGWENTTGHPPVSDPTHFRAVERSKYTNPPTLDDIPRNFQDMMYPPWEPHPQVREARDRVVNEALVESERRQALITRLMHIAKGRHLEGQQGLPKPPPKPAAKKKKPPE